MTSAYAMHNFSFVEYRSGSICPLIPNVGRSIATHFIVGGNAFIVSKNVADELAVPWMKTMTPADMSVVADSVSLTTQCIFTPEMSCVSSRYP